MRDWVPDAGVQPWAVAVSKTSGVKCTQCGASTPLPADLRVPTFPCAYCQAELSTAHYAGVGAVRVDEMGAYMHAVLQAGTVDGHIAPRLVHGTAGFRQLPCAGCKAPLDVPLDVTINKVTCSACGRTAPITQYISDVERLQIDMARQIDGNNELKRLLAEGLNCPRCNANNRFQEPVPVQLECTSCHGVILISDFVASDAVDRARLKATVFGIRDQAKAMQAANGRRNSLIIAAMIAVVIAVALAVSLTR